MADQDWQADTGFDTGELGRGGIWNGARTPTEVLARNQPPFTAGNRIEVEIRVAARSKSKAAPKGKPREQVKGKPRKSSSS